MSRGVHPGVSSVVAVAPTVGGCAGSAALASIDYDARSSLVFKKKPKNEAIFRAQLGRPNPAPTVGAGFVRRFWARFPGPGFWPLFLRFKVLKPSSRMRLVRTHLRLAKRFLQLLCWGGPAIRVTQRFAASVITDRHSPAGKFQLRPGIKCSRILIISYGTLGKAMTPSVMPSPGFRSSTESTMLLAHA